VHFVTKTSLYFWILLKKTVLLISDMTYFEKKNFHPLLRPQSADRKTFNWLQRTETHFLHKLFFKILLFWTKQYSSGPSFSYLNNWRWLASVTGTIPLQYLFAKRPACHLKWMSRKLPEKWKSQDLVRIAGVGQSSSSALPVQGTCN
jgi:hypothetical protein